MMFGDGGIFASGSGVELIDSDIVAGTLLSTGSFNFSGYAAGDEFIVIANSTNSTGGSVVQSGWTTVDSATNTRIWRRTLAADNPNTYDFRSSSSGTNAIFVGFIVRNATTFTGNSYATAAAPINMTVTGLGNPALVMAAAGNPNGSSQPTMTTGYSDHSLTDTAPDAIGVRGGSEIVSSGSQTVIASSGSGQRRPSFSGSIIAAY